MNRCFSILLICLVSAFLPKPSVTAGETDDTQWIDGQLAAAFKADEPGAAVIVVKDGKTVFRKAYGMANLELGVAMQPDMLFRIGSVTKQFTAVAILILAERGELALTDEITKFLPDYPTHGKKITVEHLLTHTSGIKGYTELPEWLPLLRKDLKLAELIAIFKDVPMEFSPGDQFAYSNSGYVLLGAIIEHVTKMSYGAFVEKTIFAPLGMKDSFYDSTERVIPRRVPGYDKKESGYVNCGFLSMTHPHAAGSLISTVDDLAKWDQALYTEKLVHQESLKKAWTSFRLNSGQLTKYGYGWMIATLGNERMIMHPGRINGFASYTVRLPDAKVYVALLCNRDTGAPAKLAERIAAKIGGTTKTISSSN